MTIQNKHRLALIERYLAAYNGFDVEAMLAVLSPDIRFENYSGGELTAHATGIEEFRHLATQSTAIFAEREQRIAALELNDNPGDGVVTARIDFRGRLAVDIAGGPPAGTVLELQGQSAFTFRGALIASIVDRS